MAVAPLPSAARDYVRAFDLTSIALWRDGRLGVSRNPTGADQAWWCPAKAAGAVVRAANANGRDVVAAAARLNPLTDHATVAQRVGEAVGRIDDGLKAAQRRGDLAFFNQLYKAQRVAAQAAGRRLHALWASTTPAANSRCPRRCERRPVHTVADAFGIRRWRTVSEVTLTPRS